MERFTMRQTYTLKQKYIQFLHIMIPIFITQTALSLMAFIDTSMSGHVSKEDMAGAAIGSSLWLPIQTGISGILMGITPIVAGYIGAKQREKVGYSVFQALWLAVGVSLSVLLVGIFTVSPILNYMGLDPKVHHIAYYFLTALAVGIFPLFGYTVLRSFIDALGQTKISMAITLLTLPLNVGAGYVLIFGHLGFPRLGGIGSGVATAFTYWCIFIIAIVIVHKHPACSSYGVFHKFYKLSLTKCKEIMKIGVPMGFAIFFETAIFAAITLLMSQFDTATIAANQAANNFSGTLYMFPLSICLSLTILVGYEVGASRHKDAKQYAKLGIFTAIGFSLVAALILLTFNYEVASIYSNELDVIDLIQHFLIYAIFFQISDAIATPTQGVLRGYRDVNSTFWITLVAYWIIGLPLGYILANFTTNGPYGYWIGLITGLGIAAVFLLYRLKKIQRRTETEIVPS